MFADGTRPALGSGGRVDLLGELAPRVTSLGDEYQNRSNWLTEISQPFSPRTRATSNRRRFFKSCRSVERRSKCASMKSTRLPTGTTRNVTVSGLDGVSDGDVRRGTDLLAGRMMVIGARNRAARNADR
jgi:hypothetical protein